MISVVMPLYNKEREVARAIRSVLAQSFQNFELIIVNDGSTDRSVDEVNCFADARIRLVNQNNQGVSAARNRGVAESRSDLVAFLDADDEWLPDFLATIIRLRKAYPEAGVYATSYWMRSTDGLSRKAILRRISAGMNEGILPDYFSVAAHSDPPLWTSAVAVNRESLISIGAFPHGIRCGEDLLTWARLTSRWPVAYSVQPLAVFWMPGTAADRPNRFDDVGDPVAEGLLALYQGAATQHRAGLKAYLGMWHRMRAVSHLRLGERKESIRNAIRSIRFSGLDIRLLGILLLAISPFGKPEAAFMQLKKLLEDRRNHAS